MNKTYFRINQYIELRLEENKTNIYIGNELITQCKYILLNIPTNQRPVRDIVSIDEAKQLYSNKHEADKSIITPETEFFAHCSNLQAWYINDYNPNVLHSNLSVPLLSRLVLRDIGVLSKLLYHLDSYWIDYESKYDKNFTIERRMMLIDKYKDVILEAFEQHQLSKDIMYMSIFATHVKLLEVLPKMFPFSFDHCEWCMERKLRYDEYGNDFVNVDVYNNAFDDTSYNSYHICGSCYENIYENDVEWCDSCGRYMDNSECAYYEEYEEVMCFACLKEAILDDGMKSKDVIEKYNRIEHSDLVDNGYIYLCSRKTESESERKLFIAEVVDLISFGCRLVVLIEDERYYNKNIEYSVWIHLLPNAKRGFEMVLHF